MFNLKTFFDRQFGRDTVIKLKRELDETKEQLGQVMSEFDVTKKALERWTHRGEPDFDADCLTVWNKNPTFMRDPHFLAAYRDGAYSGHRFTENPDDFHVEWRVAIACWAAKHGLHLQGDFVECGVNTGILSLTICRYIDFNKTGRKFFLFDTFNGVPVDQMSDQEKEREKDPYYSSYYVDCWDNTVKNFKPYPKAQLIRGTVPETLSTVEIDKVCYLSLDMNIAHPERAAMEHFWDKLVSGAIVVLDDYGWSVYHEQKAALDDFAAKRNVEIFNLPTGQGLIIKP